MEKSENTEKEYPKLPDPYYSDVPFSHMYEYACILSVFVYVWVEIYINMFANVHNKCMYYVGYVSHVEVRVSVCTFGG
jgi:hypothetical protein